MRQVVLPDGTAVSAVGQGTWYMGEGGRSAPAEADALRLGIDLGLTLIDTAEMYAEGGAEEVVGDAIAGRRDEVFLVSKVYPPGIATIVPGERLTARARPMVDYLRAFERAANAFPGFESEVQGLHREAQPDGTVRFYTYVMQE